MSKEVAQAFIVLYYFIVTNDILNIYLMEIRNYKIRKLFNKLF